MGSERDLNDLHTKHLKDARWVVLEAGTEL